MTMTRNGLTRCGRAVVASVVLAGTALVGQGTSGAEGSWRATGALLEARIAQTATLLGDGEVLVAGGRGATGALASVERYSPLDETFTATGAMAASRWSHTATLLLDGRVLVTGGFTGLAAGNAQAVTDTAEVYDPSTGAWSATAALGTRRALHAAALLPDGRVLVAGGRTCTGPPPATCDFTFRTDSAELYDPATGTFTPTGSMGAFRHTTSAAVLPGGQVLVPAGFAAADPHDTDATADRYDASTGTWSPTGTMNRSRARQGAVALPGGTVVVGPGSRSTTFGPPFVATINDTAETYDPANGSWQLTGNPVLPGRFNFQQALLPNGKALLVGGFGGPAGGEGLTRTAEVYDPATRTWAPAGTTTHLHGTSSSLANTHDAVVLSAHPRTFRFGERCGANCGKVLVVGDNLADPVADLYTPAPPVPRSMAQCMDDGWRGRSTAANEPFANQGLCIRSALEAPRNP